MVMKTIVLFEIVYSGKIGGRMTIFVRKMRVEMDNSSQLPTHNIYNIYIQYVKNQAKINFI